MEMIPNSFLENLKRSWRRRKYQRLNGSRRRVKVLRLGGGTTATGRRIWRSKTISKPRLRIASPLRLIQRFHKGYVDSIIRLVDGLGKAATGGGLFRGKKVAKNRHVMVMSGGEEVDSRFMFEVYKRLAASRELRTA